MSNLMINSVSFYFAVETKDLDQGYESDEVFVSNIPWTINIAEESVGGKAVVSVQLSSQLVTTDLNWTCESEATIAIRSGDPRQGVYQKALQKMEFSDLKRASESLEFISIADLKDFEQNGRFVFEVQIRADPVKYSDGKVFSTNVQQIRSIFRFVIDGVSDLGEKSTVQVVAGTEFKVVVRKGPDDLQIFLRNEKNPKNEHWMWNVKCGFKLLSSNQHVRPIHKQFTKKYFYNVSSRGYQQFISWNDFINPLNNYVQNDKAILEIDLQVNPPEPIRSFDQLKSIDSAVECSLCLLSIIDRDPTSTKCGHMFCGECIALSHPQRQTCPLCNSAVCLDDLRRIYF